MNTNSIIPAQRDSNGMAIIGRTRRQLMGIRYEEGEGGAGGDAAAQAAVAQVAAAAAAAKAAEDAKPPWGDDPTKFDPDKAWALIQNVKGDVAAEKAKRDQAIADAVKKASDETRKATLSDFAKLLGGGEEIETDPEKLQAKVTDLSTQIAEKSTSLTKAESDLKAATLSTAVAIHAHALGGNPALLLTNEQFKTSIASVEPTDEAAIKAAITKALQDNAALKATPPRSGSGEHQGATVQSLVAQLKTAEEKKDFRETIRLKRAIASAKTANGN